MEFTKAENRIAREIFKIALQRELENGMKEFDTVLSKWKIEQLQDHRESYHSIFKAVKDFDQHISRCYDGLRNSMLYYTLIDLLADNIITENDLNEFTEDRRNALLRIAKERRETDQ